MSNTTPAADAPRGAGGTDLPDGRYDAFVIDAHAEDRREGDASGAPRVMHLSLTIVAGEHKGEVVEVTATGLPTTSWGGGLANPELDLLGMPATLSVEGGTPHVTID